MVKIGYFRQQEKDRPSKYVCDVCKDKHGKYIEFDELYNSDIQDFDIEKIQDMDNYFKENEK